MNSQDTLMGSTCEVCEDRVNNTRYGAAACLGCTVFFRRAIIHNKQFLCYKIKKCSIHFSYRLACRYCRFEKCIRVGMKAKLIKRRDFSGPRLRFQESPTPAKPEGLLTTLTKFQRVQFSEHVNFSERHQVIAAVHTDLLNKVKHRRKACSHDVDVMLKLCIKQGSDWGNQLEPFRKLPFEFKKQILAEYCLSFLLIDQGYKTSTEVTEQGIWLLQNGSFMHTSHSFSDTQLENKSHDNFVSELIHSILNPFRKLQIDEIECAALKTILLLNPSCFKIAKKHGQEFVMAGIYTKCINEMFHHSISKFPDGGAERFGEIILLLGSIRCCVKELYDRITDSYLVQLMSFDKLRKN